jgi:hypothetical protein
MQIYAGFKPMWDQKQSSQDLVATAVRHRNALMLSKHGGAGARSCAQAMER